MKVNFGRQEINLPDILILGAAKSGTTSLAFYLKQHPNVLMPRKEPGFFAYHDRPTTEIPSGIKDRQVVDLNSYTRMYENVKPGQKICDASVAHLTNAEHTIKNARKYYGKHIQDVKAILVLRNPVDRAFSHYLMFVKNGLETLPFEEAIKPENVNARKGIQLGYDYLGGSLYAKRVEAFQNAFPNLRIYFTEDLKQREENLKDLLSFCGLRQDVIINTSAQLNPSGIPKRKGLIKLLHKRSGIKETLKIILPDRLQFRLTAIKSQLMRKSIESVSIDPLLKRDLLQSNFKEDILELEKLTGRDLANWL
jgi:hypothetical protein